MGIDRQFRELLENTPRLIAFYPDLAAYLRDYPKAELSSSKDVLFWALKDFGLKPTITITHAVGHLPKGTEDAVIAWKLVYASHYFNAALSITTYAKDSEASYLVQLDRLRADSLGGMFGKVKRTRMASAMKDDLEKFLLGGVAQLQPRARYSGAPPGSGVGSPTRRGYLAAVLEGEQLEGQPLSGQSGLVESAFWGRFDAP